MPVPEEPNFADWLRAALAGRPNVFLVKNSGVKDNGRPVIDDSRVSKWLRGEQRPSIEMVVRAANILGVDQGEALRAAGYAVATNDADGAIKTPAAAQGARTMDALMDRLTEAQVAFESAAAKLVLAEGEFDSLARYWASVMWMRDQAQPYIDDQEADLGRPLTDAERAEITSNLPRPSPYEVAEYVAAMAIHDVREWTRLEMALIEKVYDYPQDGRVGSSFADLEPARERVRRLGFRTADDPEEGSPLPTKLTPLYRGRSQTDLEGDEQDQPS